MSASLALDHMLSTLYELIHLNVLKKPQGKKDFVIPILQMRQQRSGQTCLRLQSWKWEGLELNLFA